MKMNYLESVFFLKDNDCIIVNKENQDTHIDLSKYKFFAYFNNIFSKNNLYADFSNILDENQKVKKDNFIFLIGDITNFDKEFLKNKTRNEIICFLSKTINDYKNNKLSKIDALNKIIGFYDYKEFGEQERKNLDMLQIKINDMQETEEVIKNFDFISEKIKNDNDFLCKKMIECKEKIIEEYIEKFYVWFDYIKRLAFSYMYYNFELLKKDELKVVRENIFDVPENKRNEKDIFMDLQTKLLVFYYSTKTINKEIADLIYDRYKKDIDEYKEVVIPFVKTMKKRIDEIDLKIYKLDGEYKISEYDEKKNELIEEKNKINKEYNDKQIPLLISTFDIKRDIIDNEVSKKQNSILRLKTISEDEVETKKKQKQEEINLLLMEKQNLKYGQVDFIEYQIKF